MTRNVLIVDDDLNVLYGFRRHMRKRFAIQTVTNAREALEALDSDGPFAVIVADMRMPGMDGLQLLEEFVRRAPDTVRIMLTGHPDQETAVEAVNRGNVFRFLTKPCPPETLKAAIEEGLAYYEQINTLREAALTDELTGIGNRRHFLELAGHEARRARRSGEPTSMLMLDVDHFKKVNDTFGHPVGDEVLKTVARVCSDNLREADLLGRYGGEEFAVLLPSTSAATAEMVAERIRRAVVATAVETADGPVRVTVSLGVAAAMGREADIADLLERADAALYCAKRDGRDRVVTDQGYSFHHRSAPK